jgi:ATP-dependent DNA helicase RecQ
LGAIATGSRLTVAMAGCTPKIGEPMSDTSSQEILTSIFGFKAFRGKQAEIIDQILAGKNILAVMPTGAGKSLCFQIPALMRNGVTIVVSPLISLMQNQVVALKLLGVEAATLNSNTSPEDNNIIWDKLRAGTLKLLYVSPEKLMMPWMLDQIEGLSPACFAIDEAHCISQWGASFRPEYEALSTLHKRFAGVPIIALTATADATTRAQISSKIFSDDVQIYLTGFDRPNISLNVEIKSSWKQQLLGFLKGRQRKNSSAVGKNENGIVYCLSRKKTEAAAGLLVEKGYNALAYHAGLPGHVREDNLNRFMTEPDLIMVATIAFGMGIDKPDIRFVFHTDLPSSPEAYYQEIGRAGRDGEAASAHMLYGMDDIRMRRMFIDNEDAVQAHKMRGHQRLNALLAYCEAPECRRATLLQYFGDQVDKNRCGNCDLCENPVETVEASKLGQKFLSAIYRSGQMFGVGYIVDIVTGKRTPKILQLGHDALSTFGVGEDLHANEWKSIARQLMARGFIVADMEFGSLKITDKGVKLLKGQAAFERRPDVKIKKTSIRLRKAPNRAIQEMSPEADALFQILKNYRKEIAAERSVPAYVIFSDKSLIDMSVQRPATLDEFAVIHGVGAKKKAEFGALFVRYIAEN